MEKGEVTGSAAKPCTASLQHVYPDNGDAEPKQPEVHAWRGGEGAGQGHL